MQRLNESIQETFIRWNEEESSWAIDQKEWDSLSIKTKQNIEDWKDENGWHKEYGFSRLFCYNLPHYIALNPFELFEVAWKKSDYFEKLFLKKFLLKMLNRNHMDEQNEVKVEVSEEAKVEEVVSDAKEGEVVEVKE